MRNFLRKPVFHFTILGLLFVWFALSRDKAPAPDQPDEIVITQGGVRRMVEQFNAVWHRNPHEQELAALVEGAIREEVLVREAIALGLDRGDAVIRNRLTQKMQFRTSSAAQMLDPADEVLRAYMADNPDGFTTPDLIAFDQVYLGESANQEMLDTTLAALANGADPRTLGRGGLLPSSLPLSTRRKTENTFGSGFFETLKAAETGTWVGPVRSEYGLHLVRVTEVRPAAMVQFAEVRQEVLFEWRRAESKVLAEKQYKAMRARYLVATPDAAALKKALAETD